jgi:hypothetical protein
MFKTGLVRPHSARFELSVTSGAFSPIFSNLPLARSQVRLRHTSHSFQPNDTPHIKKVQKKERPAEAERSSYD